MVIKCHFPRPMVMWPLKRISYIKMFAKSVEILTKITHTQLPNRLTWPFLRTHADAKHDSFRRCNCFRPTFLINSLGQFGKKRRSQRIQKRSVRGKVIFIKSDRCWKFYYSFLPLSFQLVIRYWFVQTFVQTMTRER